MNGIVVLPNGHHGVLASEAGSLKGNGPPASKSFTDWQTIRGSVLFSLALIAMNRHLSCPQNGQHGFSDSIANAFSSTIAISRKLFMFASSSKLNEFKKVHYEMNH